ncbi:unnamed protein product [Calypogeia fissa]
MQGTGVSKGSPPSYGLSKVQHKQVNNQGNCMEVPILFKIRFLTGRHSNFIHGAANETTANSEPYENVGTRIPIQTWNQYGLRSKALALS